MGNCVLNTAFYRPVLLARDLAAVDSAIGGRLEIRLGAGYVEGEFTSAGLRFPTPAERVQLLGEHVQRIRATFADPDYSPAPIQQAPPIMIGGAGKKILAMAAREADIVSLLTLGSEAELAQRVSFVKDESGARFDEIELSFSFSQVSLDDPTDRRILDLLVPDATDSEIQSMATVLDRSIEDAAERIVRLHRQLGHQLLHLHLHHHRRQRRHVADHREVGDPREGTVMRRLPIQGPIIRQRLQPGSCRAPRVTDRSVRRRPGSS